MKMTVISKVSCLSIDLRRRVFKSLVTIAEEGLKEAFSAVPPDKQLRKLVSQWLQDVLRYRSDITMRPLLSDGNQKSGGFRPPSAWRYKNGRTNSVQFSSCVCKF
jgi:hypothetical protein